MDLKTTALSSDKRLKSLNSPLHEQAIGIFDSGLGGLTVMREVIAKVPNEHLVYFGDTARVPYGDKSRETIIQYSSENADFLQSHHIKLLIVACNSASAHAYQFLQEKYSFTVVDVVEPAVQRAVRTTQNGRIAVLGTKATICSEVYQNKIKAMIPDAEVFAYACPLFVPLVEENFLKHPSTKLIITEYLKPLKALNIDTLILGCTHYPLLQELIDEEMEGRVTLLDSATACAEQVKTILEEKRLGRQGFSEGKRQYFVSDDPEKFRQLGENFLGISICHVEYVKEKMRIENENREFNEGLYR